MHRLLVALLILASTPASANSALWFDPDMGCGRGATFAKTGKMVDLPGCTGRLPKNPPQVEVVLHDAKRALVEADELIVKNKLDKVDGILDATQLAISHSQPLNPELPDRWEQSRPLYERAILSLKNRRRLVPRLEKLKAAHHAAVETGKTMTTNERDGGPAAALTAAKACIVEFAEARATGIDLTAEIELEKDRPRPLEESLAECEQVRKTAEPLVRALELAAKTKRAEWRKKLKGDRLKTFDAHPNAYPDIPGGAKVAAKAVVWKYTTTTGSTVYTFKKDKLVSEKALAK